MIAIVWCWATAAAQETPAETESAPVAPAVEDEAPPAPPKEPQDLRRFGIDIQVGSLTNTDPAWDLFNGDGDAMTSFGFSGSARFHHNLSAVAAWHHVRKGSVVFASNTGTDTDDILPDLQSFTAAYYGNEFSAGLRGDIPLAQDVWFPFLKAQGMVMTSLVRLDDDTEVEDNPGQESFTGASPGFLLTAGMEVRIPPQVPVQVGLELELGYGWLATTDLDELGEMQPGGFVVRSGVGVRF